MLELFLGYPLRLMASVFAETILHGAGLPVSRDSVEIVWAGRPVWVDAPCSGIRMLWGGVWLALIATGLHRLNGWRTSIAVVLAVVVVTLANMLRVTALCLSSVTLLPPGEPLHTGMGVAAFATGTLLIVWFVRILSRRSAIPLAARPHKADPTRTAGRTAFLLACLAAAAIQLLPKPTSAMSVQGFRFPGWPATFEGRRLRATPLTPQETAFNTSFPGRIARFEDGTRVIIWRWITQPTHRVHSAMNCLHSSGWHVTPQPMHHDAAGGTWSCFLAERRDVRLRVREQCTDSSGGIWPDVPAWFWAAWMGHSTGPWQVVTVAERVQN